MVESTRRLAGLFAAPEEVEICGCMVGFVNTRMPGPSLSEL